MQNEFAIAVKVLAESCRRRSLVSEATALENESRGQDTTYDSGAQRRTWLNGESTDEKGRETVGRIAQPGCVRVGVVGQVDSQVHVILMVARPCGSTACFR